MSVGMVAEKSMVCRLGGAECSSPRWLPNWFHHWQNEVRPVHLQYGEPQVSREIHQADDRGQSRIELRKATVAGEFCEVSRLSVPVRVNHYENGSPFSEGKRDQVGSICGSGQLAFGAAQRCRDGAFWPPVWGFRRFAAINS